MALEGRCSRVALAVAMAGVAFLLSAAGETDRPTWVQMPDAFTLSRHYPIAAHMRRQDGTATLECLIIEDGYLSRCRVVEEAPSDYQFGEAALGLVPYFQLSRQTPSGRPTYGMWVRIPVRFKSARYRGLNSGSHVPADKN